MDARFWRAAASEDASACFPRGSRSITPDTPKPDRLRFPSACHLRTASQFAAVRKWGRSVHGRLMRVSVYLSDNPDPCSLFGVVTSRKVGGAVDRNRVRRQIREVIRLNRPRVTDGVWVVTIAKRAAAHSHFAAIREEWLRHASALSILRDFA